LAVGQNLVGSSSVAPDATEEQVRLRARAIASSKESIVMPQSTKCKCGKQLRMKDELVGKRVKCPGCGAVLLIPKCPVETGVPAAEAPLKTGSARPPKTTADKPSSPPSAAAARPSEPTVSKEATPRLAPHQTIVPQPWTGLALAP